MLMFRDFTDALGDRVKRQHSSILSFYVFANCIQTLWVIITIYDIFVCTHRGISSPMIIPLLYYIAIGMYIKRTSRRQAKQEVFQREYIYMHLSSSSYLYPACCQPYKYTARRGRTARTCVNVRKGISVISITRQEWFFFLYRLRSLGPRIWKGGAVVNQHIFCFVIFLFFLRCLLSNRNDFWRSWRRAIEYQTFQILFWRRRGKKKKTIIQKVKLLTEENDKSREGLGYYHTHTYTKIDK